MGVTLCQPDRLHGRGRRPNPANQFILSMYQTASRLRYFGSLPGNPCSLADLAVAAPLGPIKSLTDTAAAGRRTSLPLLVAIQVTGQVGSQKAADAGDRRFALGKESRRPGHPISLDGDRRHPHPDNILLDSDGDGCLRRGGNHRHPGNINPNPGHPALADAGSDEQHDPGISARIPSSANTPSRAITNWPMFPLRFPSLGFCIG